MGRNVHCRPEERVKISTLREQGKSQREIAKIIGCSKKMVENALKYNKKIETRGNKRQTTSQTDRQIARAAKLDPFMTSVQLKRDLQLQISARTIRRRLQEAHLHGRVARKVPLLTSKNIKARLQFAHTHVGWNGTENIKKIEKYLME